MQKRFKVALSFSGEHRSFVQKVVSQLEKSLGKGAVFYDKFYQAELAIANADTYLQNIYRDQSELFVVFISKSYTEKEWCGIEWRVVREVINNRKGEGIMLLRFDNTPIEGISNSLDGYVMIAGKSAQYVRDLILQRVTKRPEPVFPLREKRKKKQIVTAVSVFIVAAVIIILFMVMSKKQQMDVKDPSGPANEDSIPSHDTGKIGTTYFPKIPGRIMPYPIDKPQKPKIDSNNLITGTVRNGSKLIQDAEVNIPGYGNATTDRFGNFSIKSKRYVEELQTLTINFSHPEYNTKTSHPPYNKTGLILDFQQEINQNEKDSL